LLGPLAIDARYKGRGFGIEMMNHALNMAKVLGHHSVVLVGDEPYYGRFGFTRGLVADLHLPGPVDRDRFLGLELVSGALNGAESLVMASGDLAPTALGVRAA
jgi:predicted N-acetyltransferase YhbS